MNTFMKTLLACGLLMLAAEATSEIENKIFRKSKLGNARPQRYWSAPKDKIPEAELKVIVDDVINQFNEKPLATLARQFADLESITNEYIGWEQSTPVEDEEYILHIKPYVKIMACLQRSNNTYIQYLYQTHASDLQTYSRIGFNGAVGTYKIVDKFAKGKWFSGVIECLKHLPSLWARYKIEFEEGGLEDFQENMLTPGKPERFLAWIKKHEFTLIDGQLTKFMTEFKAGLTTLRSFFSSLQKLDQRQNVANFLKTAATETTAKEKLKAQFVENNERLLQILKTNLEFSRTQYGLHRALVNNDSIIVMDLTKFEKLMQKDYKVEDYKIKAGDKIYHSLYESGTFVSEKNGETLICKFNQFGEEKIAVKKNELMKVLEAVTMQNEIKDVKFTSPVTTKKKFGFTHGNPEKTHLVSVKTRVYVVDPNSEAEDLGVCVGDRILEIDGKKATHDNINDLFKEAKETGKKVTVKFGSGKISHVVINEANQEVSISVKFIKVVPTMTINGVFKGMFVANLNSSNGFREYIRGHGGAAVGLKLINEFCGTVTTLRTRLLLESAADLERITPTEAELQAASEMIAGDVAGEQTDEVKELPRPSVSTKALGKKGNLTGAQIKARLASFAFFGRE